MGEVNADTPGQQPAPERTHLFALADGVGGDEGASYAVIPACAGMTDGRVRLWIPACAGMTGVHVFGGFHIPGGDEIQQPAAWDIPEHGLRIGALSIVHELGAHERRIAQDVTQPLARHQGFPIQPQRIAADDMRAGGERDADEVQAEFFADFQIHLVVHQPERDLGDLCGEFLDLDAVKLIDANGKKAVEVQPQAAAARIAGAGAQHIQLQQPQLAVGHHQKIAAAAGGIEKGQPAQFLVELEQPVAVVFDLVELGAQFVEKQRADQLEDVLFAGVVGAQVAARPGVHDRLEQCAENRRTDLAPVERAGIEQGFAHGAVEIGDRQNFLEQLAVDIGKGGELFIEGRRALALGRIEHLEKLCEQRAEIAAVLGGAVFDPVLKRLAGLEDAGVFGEQAEQQAHQQQFQRVTCVAARLEAVVQAAHAFGGLAVDGIFGRERLGGVAGDESEQADALVQVRQREFLRGAGFEIVQAHTREVGHQHIARQLALDDAGEVVQRLLVGAVEVLATRLVFGDQHALPEQVDLAAPIAEFFGRLFKAGDAPPRDAEDVEELVPEGLCLGGFPRLVSPLARERQRPILDLVPAQRHARLPSDGVTNDMTTRFIEIAN